MEEYIKEQEEDLEELIKHYVKGYNESEINVYGYARVSTEKQVKEGYSLGGQIRSIGEYCAYNKMNLVNIFKDEGISGAKVDEDDEIVSRPGIQDLMAGLKRNNIKYVVVLNTARLWRSDIATFLIQRELRKNKVDVKSIENISYSLYTDSPSDFLISGMTELVDAYDRLSVIYRLKKGRRDKASIGGFSTGSPPLGYRTLNKQLEIEPDEADTVYLIFALNFTFPDMSLQQIADRLNMIGKRTKRGKLFTPMTVKRVLDKMEFYMGMVYVDDKWIDGKHSPILK